jgi:hypothetical protein
MGEVSIPEWIQQAVTDAVSEMVAQRKTIVTAYVDATRAIKLSQTIASRMWGLMSPSERTAAETELSHDG